MGRGNFKVDTMSTPVALSNDRAGGLKLAQNLIILLEVYSDKLFFFLNKRTKCDLFYYLGNKKNNAEVIK